MEEQTNPVKAWCDLIEEQIKLIIEWNKQNINHEPEQVRKNIETIYNILDKFAF